MAGNCKYTLGNGYRDGIGGNGVLCFSGVSLVPSLTNYYQNGSYTKGYWVWTGSLHGYTLLLPVACAGYDTDWLNLAFQWSGFLSIEGLFGMKVHGQAFCPLEVCLVWRSMGNVKWLETGSGPVILGTRFAMMYEYVILIKRFSMLWASWKCVSLPNG